MKILVSRFSSIGDIVLTTPVFRCIKKQRPETQIHFVTKKAYAGLLEHNPYIDKIWALDDDFQSLVTDLKKEKFELLVDLHNNLRTRRLKLSLGIKRVRFNKINWQKWLIVNTRINRLPEKHIVDRYLETVAQLKVTNDGLGLDFHIDPEAELPTEVTSGQAYVCFAIGGQHNTKKLPTEKIIALCNQINLPVYLIGGPEDQSVGKEIETQIDHVTSLCGQISIQQSARVIEHADWVISHDTGMMHIAAALNKKIVSIWGNTIPQFGMYPYRAHPDSLISEVENLSCRPCSKIGFEQCPKGHFSCMLNQDLDAIARPINEVHG